MPPIGVEWEIDSFVLYKSPRMDGMFPGLLQERQRVIVPYLVRIFHSYQANRYIQAIWHQIKVGFIPKPSKNSYCGPRDTTGHNPGLLLAF